MGRGGTSLVRTGHRTGRAGKNSLPPPGSERRQEKREYQRFFEHVGPALPLLHRLRRGQHDARRNGGGPGQADGDTSEVGLIQTMPAIVNAESLFGRIQQFANRLYAPVFIAGLNYWAQGFGNYWGHNAIIRTDPFMQYCDLPSLPGRKPFGGQILSHDFVEAALLLKENWQVWFAHELQGSYEETPQDI